MFSSSEITLFQLKQRKGSGPVGFALAPSLVSESALSFPDTPVWAATLYRDTWLCSLSLFTSFDVSMVSLDEENSLFSCCRELRESEENIITWFLVDASHKISAAFWLMVTVLPRLIDCSIIILLFSFIWISSMLTTSLFEIRNHKIAIRKSQG